jgi:hypothetical protein
MPIHALGRLSRTTATKGIGPVPPDSRRCAPTLKRETDRELRALLILAEISLSEIRARQQLFTMRGALRYVNVAVLKETHPREQRA